MSANHEPVPFNPIPFPNIEAEEKALYAKLDKLEGEINYYIRLRASRVLEQSLTEAEAKLMNDACVLASQLRLTLNRIRAIPKS